ncbi:FMN-dependent NADH-azoreductase [Pseudonocardia hierapolitana]|uniref:FMN dependent NADH:quinone oxidoreductase n=1 Tax=Pseudonocardia hierapolitana TaxID=1128676 RepID=A0A561SXV7_9PSEU|nr:NAD(P)H-dependent oxidoreductase [Pseudonocardia hierapolitana]TWF79681.1 FMN-dependent NADH-azoreductase [Pseudonocardia hierapolitana]
MTLFRVDSSIQGDASVSRAVADVVERAWRDHHPEPKVVRRDLAANPVPADAWPLAVAAMFAPDAERTPQQRAAATLASSLADELLGADAALVAAPLYNYGVSQHLKTWLDLVLTDPRLAPGSAGLGGRPVTIVVSRGGGYGPGTPREGWDHDTPYVQRIFGDVLGGDVTVVTAELTLAALKPEMAHLRELADASRARAIADAAASGRALAERVAPAGVAR